MKKDDFAIFPFVISLFCAAGMAALGVDAIAEYRRLSQSPWASGIDYLGLMLYAMYFFALSAVGAAGSLLHIKLSKPSVLRTISGVLAVIFIMVAMISFGMWMS